jgi:hypothetical protein
VLNHANSSIACKVYETVSYSSSTQHGAVILFPLSISKVPVSKFGYNERGFVIFFSVTMMIMEW